MDQESARKELRRRGIPYLEEQFIRYVRNGNQDTVDLFLSAGISPNAALDGDTAFNVAVREGHKEIARTLLAAGADPLMKIEGLHPKPKRKDVWEKLASISGVFTFASSLIIAATGWYFTNRYNERQLAWTQAQAREEQANKSYQNRLAEMQTVEKMIPHLAKDEPSKQAALVAISVLASPNVATRIAEVYGGQGSIDALTQIATVSKKQPAPAAVSALTNIAAGEQAADAASARDALTQVLAGREKAVVTLFVNGSRACNGFMVDHGKTWVVTAGYCIPPEARANWARQVVVRTSEGKLLTIRSIAYSKDQLLTLIQVEPPGALPRLSLSRRSIVPGTTVLQLANDLGAPQPSSQPLVVLGQAMEVGKMSFSFAGNEQIVAAGIKVSLPDMAGFQSGKAGGPLLDSEGNVACLTYQRSQTSEQCVSAGSIQAALDAVPGR